MLTPPAVLDRYFLDCRSQLLELAATLDRFDRAGPVPGAGADGRLEQLRQMLAIVAGPGPDRAEKILRLLSDPVE
jgi:hypothetical protein